MHSLVLMLALLQGVPTAANPATTSGAAIATYNSLKGFIKRSLEKMPVEHFTFQPTPEVRSFGQVVAHIVDANYLLCSPALEEPNPNGSVITKTEEAKLSREAMRKALDESFAYCDRAYARMTEANANDTVPFMGNQTRTRVGVLWFHIAHGYEHYGNLVTYMRLKGIVPPSSEPAPRPRTPR